MNKIIENSLFLKETNNNINNNNNSFSLEEKLLDSALNKSAQDIKTLIVQYFGHYNDTLLFWIIFLLKFEIWVYIIFSKRIKIIIFQL